MRYTYYLYFALPYIPIISKTRTFLTFKLARQNVITKQILEAFIQKKLGLASTNLRAPSIFDILPAKKPEDRTTRQSSEQSLKNPPESSGEVMEDSEMLDDSEMTDDLGTPEDPEIPETPVHYAEDDSLQSVESEQIDSIYSEGII
ncbi:unnamed protein product, partial [Brenthis ino]